MDRTYRAELRLLIGALLMLCVFLGVFTSTLTAQNQITENPEGAVKLRRIWSLKGWGRVDSVVGRTAAGIGDINDDGFDDFSVSIDDEAWIFLGDDPPSKIPVFRVDSAVNSGTRSPIVGDFLGNGDTLAVFVYPRCNPANGACYVRARFYRTDVEGFLEQSDLMLSINELMSGNFALHAADLDRDGDDELIVVNDGDGRNTKVRIYRGGADFTLAEPTMTMTTESSFYSSIVDFDADGHPDLCLAHRAGNASRLRFWWGSQSSPWSWTDTPDRINPSFLTEIGLSSVPNLLVDYNGDRQMDFAHNTGTDFYLWLSNPSLDVRTRLFDSTDFDLHVTRASGGSGYGYIADSLRRYMMLPILPPRDEPNDSAKGLGGGADGPNMTFDAWFPGNEGPLSGGWDVGDVDGNGWQDRIIHSGEYGGPGVGIALIIGGGPYIPSDDPTVDVREIATGEHVRAIHIWPNPVDDEMHIAWRENITAKPARLTLHDVSGRLLLDERVRYWKGEQTISCAGVAAGAYLLSFYDNDGTMIATTEVIKR